MPDPRSFRTIICDGLFEPRVLESLLGRDALFGIVLEDVAEQVNKLLVKCCSGWYDLL